jgi:hypothetical protein
MFNFSHPQPVVSRKPVAEMTIKQAARKAIDADTVLQALPNEHRQRPVLTGVAAPSPKLPAGRRRIAGAPATTLFDWYAAKAVLGLGQVKGWSGP